MNLEPSASIVSGSSFEPNLKAATLCSSAGLLHRHQPDTAMTISTAPAGLQAPKPNLAKHGRPTLAVQGVEIEGQDKGAPVNIEAARRLASPESTEVRH